MASGLFLFLFVVCHLANHALGLVSLAAMEAGRAVFLALWRLPPVELALVLALLAHPALALWRLWERRTWRMPMVELVQMTLGLLIPFYLTVHVLGTGWLHRCCGVIDSYAYLLANLWPDRAVGQIILLTIVWLHGTIGVHRWLRLKPRYRLLRPWLLVLATVLPLLALGGFISAGRELATVQASDPARWAELARPQPWALDQEFRRRYVGAPEQWIIGGFCAVLAALLALRTLRWAAQQRRLVRLSYPDGRQVSVPRGFSVLEASIVSGIPHAAVCGGRGRCSTCRVRVGRGREHLPPPTAAEQRVLARIAAPPDVRLACQIRPQAALAVTPLMPASAGPREVLQVMGPAQGVERTVAVLFCDLRGFTKLSQERLPYDTVFILNRYFAAMGEAIEVAGGQVDKFIGDGIMALFGVNGSAASAARAAIDATRRMAVALDRLNQELAVELEEPLRMGIGLHLGPAILGRMGYGQSRPLTAIGDTVNLASRLEALTKELGCQLIVSDAVARYAPEVLQDYPLREIDVRGRDGRLPVRLVDEATHLPPVPSRPTSARDRAWLRGLGLLRGLQRSSLSSDSGLTAVSDRRANPP